MTGFREYLSSTFPGVRVTSGARDPNSRLGRANPRSWHNVGKAWDTAPVEGMTFDDYVNRISQDGWNVLEARDEVKNPSRHATGPHWHVAVDGRKEMAGNGLAGIMESIYKGTPFLPPVQTPDQEQMASTGLASLMPQMQPPMQDTSAAKRPVWKDILGGVLDTIAIAGGREGSYWPQILQQQQLETEGRQKLAEQMAKRQATIEDYITKRGIDASMPQPTNAQREYEWMRTLSPEQRAAYQKWATEVYRPQFFEQGGQRYQVTPGGGLPQGYDPNEWEVVE